MLIGKNVHKMTLTNLTFGAPQSISFYGILPDEFTESHSTNFEQIDIKGRSNPLWAYAGSSARETSITVTLHEDYLAEFMGGSADIREFVAAIRSITYPEYQGTMTVPPTILLRIGSFFKMKGICQSCQVTWKKPIRDNRYIVADISISIAEALEDSYTASEVFSMSDLVRM